MFETGDGEYIAQITKSDFGVWPHDEGFEGYVVTTNKRRISIGISKGQSCCEVTGYFTSEDDPKSFVGKRLMKVEVVDTLLNKEQIESIEYLDQGGVMFVNFVCNDDELQFVCYNSHNGYYGHEAVVMVSKEGDHQGDRNHPLSSHSVYV